MSINPWNNATYILALKLTGEALCRHTVYKSYVCDFSQTILSNLLTPQRGYWIECNTTQVLPTLSADSSASKCQALV